MTRLPITIHRHERALIIGVTLLLLISSVFAGITPTSTRSGGTHGVSPVDPLKSPFIVDWQDTPKGNTTPLTPVNNTTAPPPPPVPKPVPKPQPQPLRFAVGGDVQYFDTCAELDYYQRINVTEIHVVVPAGLPYANVLKNIQAHNMTPVYDGEVPFWMQCWSNQAYTGEKLSQLQAIRAAGWRYFASEGLYATQVNQLVSLGFLYINYGGDRCENLYTLASFGPHSPTSHYANYEEYYELQFKTQAYATIAYNAKMTPLHNGILIAGWYNTAYGSANPALIKGEMAKTVTELNGAGANVRTVLIWSGLGYDPRWSIDGNLKPTLDELRALRFV